MPRMLKNRAGFTLVELLVSLALSAAIGAALTGVLVNHAQLFDAQEKTAFARGVSHGGMNLILSELRMLETSAGIISASNTHLTVKAPYAMGLVCSTQGHVTISRLPVDSVVLARAEFKGYAFRRPDGTFRYVVTTAGTNNYDHVCTNAGVTVLTVLKADGTTDINQSGNAVQFTAAIPSPAPAIGTTVFMWHEITYEFKASGTVPGTIALWRTVGTQPAEELVAPFDTTAKFRFYVNDATTAQTAVPGTLTELTGVELTLDGLSERPNRSGARHGVPLKTSIFFKNRP